MRTTLTLLLTATIVLAGCSDWGTSRANPRNWFGSSTTVAPDTLASHSNALLPEERKSIFARAEALDSSVPIASITELQVDPTSTGAIVRATGVASRQGAFGARLRLEPPAEGDPSGLVVYSFRVLYPEEATNQGAENTRTITAAVTLSRQELASVRTVRVIGQDNAREARRR
ncbi:hypothetical protein [Primorskyibacter sp. S87]|uniref:hypothetical protein n=1 Tax=Primorskyibacter sp. S87 TaxID=3415126 RepID=UPI003C7B4470